MIPNLLLFYYEAIERPVLSSAISIMHRLVKPLISVIVLYNLIGANRIWIKFSVGVLISMAIVVISVKVIQKEAKYDGLFFIEKDLVDKTKNFVLTDNNLEKEGIV